jgi:hypothetical protein
MAGIAADPGDPGEDPEPYFPSRFLQLPSIILRPYSVFILKQDITFNA